jgi:hypothetical protein
MRMRNNAMHMVRRAAVSLLLVAWAAVAPVSAQDDYGITDNSFLVEEAFNQEAGIFQNILNYRRWKAGEWLASFTQEWPLPSMRHQLSFTVPFGRALRDAGIGDVIVNYRLQVLEEGPGRPAFSPRVSVIIPSASDNTDLGDGVMGLQFNAPFSKRARDWYLHGNAGLTYLVGDDDVFGENAGGLVSPFVAGSAIWRASPTFNLLVELVGESIAISAGNGAIVRTQAFTISPGFRYAWNPRDSQVVVGVAVPVTRSERQTRGSVFGYFSYELPFK